MYPGHVDGGSHLLPPTSFPEHSNSRPHPPTSLPSLCFPLSLHAQPFPPPFLLKIGTYNPLPGKDGTKEVATDVERARYWLSNGAQPSDRVAWLFNKVGIVPDVPQRVSKTYLEVPKSIKKELESA